VCRAKGVALCSVCCEMTAAVSHQMCCTTDTHPQSGQGLLVFSELFASTKPAHDPHHTTTCSKVTHALLRSPSAQQAQMISSPWWGLATEVPAHTRLSVKIHLHKSNNLLLPQTPTVVASGLRCLNVPHTCNSNRYYTTCQPTGVSSSICH
jgi:hypothetical protein